MNSILLVIISMLFGAYVGMQIGICYINITNNVYTNWLNKYSKRATKFGKKILFLIFLINIPSFLLEVFYKLTMKIYRRLLYEIGVREDK